MCGRKEENVVYRQESKVVKCRKTVKCRKAVVYMESSKMPESCHIPKMLNVEKLSCIGKRGRYLYERVRMSGIIQS